MIRSVFKPMPLPVQGKQVHRQVNSVVMPRAGQATQQAIGKIVVPPLLMLGMVFGGVTQWVKSAVAQTAVAEGSHAPSIVDKLAQRVLVNNMLACSKWGELLAVSNVPRPPSIFAANTLLNNNTPVMAVLGKYDAFYVGSGCSYG